MFYNILIHKPGMKNSRVGQLTPVTATVENSYARNRKTDLKARLIASKKLWHEREHITASYLGR